ncbi:hypothetical protein Tco_1346861 [Tanacetum coccineum]
MWLTTFHIDGTPTTVVNFQGAITLRTVQCDLSYAETFNDRMKHQWQWEGHRDHYEEEFDTFYKPYPQIQDKERLEIPSDFFDIYPIHMYTKALMRHNGYEELMRVQMVPHRENPGKTSHVNVFGR